MVPGIDPKVDIVFKRLFGTEANADLLIDLLNAVPDAQKLLIGHATISICVWAFCAW
jgi:hypothetical protein